MLRRGPYQRPNRVQRAKKVVLTTGWGRVQKARGLKSPTKEGLSAPRSAGLGRQCKYSNYIVFARIKGRGGVCRLARGLGPRGSPAPPQRVCDRRDGSRRRRKSTRVNRKAIPLEDSEGNAHLGFHLATLTLARKLETSAIRRERVIVCCLVQVRRGQGKGSGAGSRAEKDENESA